MKISRNRLTRGYLDDLLEGRSTRADALTDILSAARAPGTPHEVDGLGAALAAFASVSDSDLPVLSAAAERRSPLLTRLITAKVLGATAGAVALGGVAVAASTGSLPSPLPHSDHASSVAVDRVAATHEATTAATSESPEPTEGPESSAAVETEAAEPSKSAEHTGTPSPSLPGLCRAWLARPHEAGKADDSTAFTVLVKAAGGDKAAVEGYCTTVLATARPSRPAGAPSDPNGEHGKPTDVPSKLHTTGAPVGVPTPEHPVSRPTPLPSAAPSGPAGR